MVMPHRPVQFEITEPTRDALTAWIKDVGTQGIQLIGAVKNARFYDEMNETGAAALMRVLGKDRGRRTPFGVERAGEPAATGSR
jgi:hypothetical protein